MSMLPTVASVAKDNVHTGNLLSELVSGLSAPTEQMCMYMYMYMYMHKCM